MYRESLKRLIGEISSFEYDAEIDLERRQRDREDVDSERRVQRGESRGGNKGPSVDDDGWVKIKNYNASELEKWDQRGERVSTGRKWEHMDLLLKLNRLRAGACEGAVSRGGGGGLTRGI